VKEAYDSLLLLLARKCGVLPSRTPLPEASEIKLRYCAYTIRVTPGEQLLLEYQLQFFQRIGLEPLGMLIRQVGSNRILDCN